MLSGLLPEPATHSTVGEDSLLGVDPWSRDGDLKARDLVSEAKLSHLILTFPLLLFLKKASSERRQRESFQAMGKLHTLNDHGLQNPKGTFNCIWR